MQGPGPGQCLCQFHCRGHLSLSGEKRLFVDGKFNGSPRRQVTHEYLPLPRSARMVHVSFGSRRRERKGSTSVNTTLRDVEPFLSQRREPKRREPKH